MDDFELKIENFDGPLDVLLELIKEKHMDIFEIDLFALATSYLELIQNLKDEHIELASDYLVMASTLLHIKSKMVLENPDQEQEIDDDKERLMSQLLEYQQYKELSIELKNKEFDRKKIIIKKPEDYKEFEEPIDETQLDGKSNPIKLMTAMRKMFERIYAEKLKVATIKPFNLSPADRRKELLEMLKTNDNPTFADFFTVPSIEHFVVTMITVLDMSRREEVSLIQDEQFGEIKIIKGGLNE